jgi:hypothetical protein
MWFFQRGFAFRLADRFQSLSEFTSELMRFADVSREGPLDPIEQFKILSHNVETTDRNVQLVALRGKYSGLLQPIRSALATKLNPVTKHQGSFDIGNVALRNQFDTHHLKGEPLDSGNANAFIVSRQHFEGAALVALIGVAEGMDIHLYAAGYTRPIAVDKPIEWSKIAVVEEADKKISDRTLTVVVDALSNMLAREIRNLNLKREQK